MCNLYCVVCYCEVVGQSEGVRLVQWSSAPPTRTWAVIGWSQSVLRLLRFFPLHKNQLSRQNLCRPAYWSRDVLPASGSGVWVTTPRINQFVVPVKQRTSQQKTACSLYVKERSSSMVKQLVKNRMSDVSWNTFKASEGTGTRKLYPIGWEKITEWCLGKGSSENLVEVICSSEVECSRAKQDYDGPVRARSVQVHHQIDLIDTSNLRTKMERKRLQGMCCR